MLNKQQSISAQVILLPAQGKPAPSAPPTAKTLPAYLPSPEAARVTQQYFTQVGFQVGNLVGNNFTVTAPIETFENVLQAQIRQRAQDAGTFEVVQDDGSGTYELPLLAIPPAVRQYVEVVTLVPPYAVHV